MEKDSPGVLLRYLRTCSPSKFLQIISDALSERQHDGNAETRLCLAQFYRNSDPGTSPAVYEIEAVGAPPDRESCAAFEENGYWENGFCEICRVGIVSYAKEAICPICGSLIELT
jgi:hypothetical protein